MSRVALILTMWLAGAEVAPAQSFHFFPKSGVVRSVMGGEDVTPFPGGPPGQGFAVAHDGKKAWAAVGWDALIVREYDVISGRLANPREPARLAPWPGFRGPVSLTTDGSTLHLSQPDGAVILIDPATLKPTGRVETGRKEPAVLVAPAPPPQVADFNPPVAFGTGNRYVYIAFNPTDDIVPPADKAWLCREVAAYFKRTCNVDFLVSTRWPPLPGPGKAPLDPSRFGTVRVVPSDQWPFGMRVGVASPAAAAAWNADAVGWKGTGERPVWAWIDKAAYRRQYGREALLATVCHEMCHAIGRLPDLYKPRPNGTWDAGPPGNLMSAGGDGDPLANMKLTPEQIRLVQTGASSWMGGAAGGWVWDPN